MKTYIINISTDPLNQIKGMANTQYIGNNNFWFILATYADFLSQIIMYIYIIVIFSATNIQKNLSWIIF